MKVGQTLAFIEPPLPVAQQIQSLSIELSLRSFDLEMKRLEAERTVVQAKTRVDFAQRAYKRITALRAKELGTKQQLEKAEQNLRLAESEKTTADTIKISYDQVAEKLGKLRTQAQQGLSVEAFRIALVAPITGVVTSAHYIEGEHLEAHTEIFRLINTDDVLLVARVSEFDLARVPNAPAAVMTLPAYPGRRFEILGADSGQFLDFSKVVDPGSRTVQIRYQLSNPQGLFRVGMFADVFLETKSVPMALAVPEGAIVTDLGKTVLFALVHGELFERREVTLGIRDGGFVEVKQGLAVGERVVTRGAYAVKLAALSPESFSHGHAH